jgi:PAS domain S-box-containing protein
VLPRRCFFSKRRGDNAAGDLLDASMTNEGAFSTRAQAKERPLVELRLVGWLLLAAAFTVALCWLLYRRETDAIEQRIHEREAVRAALYAQIVESYLQPVAGDLRILADGDGLKAYLASGSRSDLERATQRAIFVSRLRHDYDQLRYLDALGHERLRVDRDGKVVAVDRLQDKSGRLYFQQAAKLDYGQIYISAPDLNVENDRIELPYKPVIRFATPVFDTGGQRHGVFVINVLGQGLIDVIQQSAPQVAHRLRMIDARGYWLKAEKPNFEWGFQLPNRSGATLAVTDAALWGEMAGEAKGQARRAGGLISWQHVALRELSRDQPSPVVAQDSFLIVASELVAAEYAEPLAAAKQTYWVLTPVLLTLMLSTVWFFHARRLALEKLRRNEESLAVTLYSIGDAVLATDTEGNLTWMNRVAEQLTGWTQTQARDRPIAEVFRIINEETRLPAQIPVEDVLTTGEIKGLANHTVLVARDGSERPIADSAAPIRDRDGGIRGVVLVFRDVSAEHAAAKALRESESRYRTLFESIDEGFCVVEMIFDEVGKPVDYRFVQINPAFEEQTGQSDALGKRARELTPELEANWFETFGRIALTGEPLRFQNRAEQLQRTFDVYAFRFGNPEERRVAILFKDITEKHRAQAELDRFFSLSLDFLCISGADGYFKRVSPAVTDMLGWSVDEFLSTPYIDLVHPDDRQATLREVEKQMRSGEKVLHFENRYRHKDGSWRLLSWRSVPHGTMMYATARDITEMKNMEEQLRRSNTQLEQKVQERTHQLQQTNENLLRGERRFRALIENAIDGISVVDADYRFLYVSPGLAALEGASASDLIGRSAIENLHPDDVDGAEHCMALAAAQPDRPIPILWRRAHRDGELRWLEGSVTNLRDDPAVAGIVINYRDVTERNLSDARIRQFTEALERSNRELQEFAFVVSHDLQEPLRKIQTFGDRLMMRNGEALDDTGRGFLERIQSAAERSRLLIDELLMFSRVSAAAKTFERVDLNAVSNGVVSDLEILIEQVGGRINVDTLPLIDAHPTQMRQLLQNLIGNALKFRRRDVAPVVEISAEVTSGQAHISIADNGIGFEEKYAERIFQVFKRLVGREEYEGSGIGLSVCRKIVDWHGGSISATSTPGVGSVFVVVLPLKQ